MVRHEQVVLFILTAVIGMLGGEPAVLFRETITFFQEIALEAQCLDDIYAKFAWCVSSRPPLSAVSLTDCQRENLFRAKGSTASRTSWKQTL